jgi:integrase
MRTTLTPTKINAAIKAATTTARIIVLNDPIAPGLNIRVGSRSASWTWLGRDPTGRVRRFLLGRWPHVGLAEARRRARRMTDDVQRGVDPVVERRARRTTGKAAASSGHTLAGLLDLYGRQVGKDVKSWAPQMEPQIRRVFRAHLETSLANLSVGALQMTVDGHEKPKSAAFGLRCLLIVLRWATAPGRGYVDRAVLDLRTSAPKPSRDRVLSRDELAKLLPVLRASDSPYADAMKLILLTATRRSEIASARWQDIAYGAWTLPSTKNGQQHVIPLSRQASALLRGLQPVQEDPLRFVFTTSSNGPLTAWEAATERLQEASGTEGWTRHDLRRTAATLMGEMGVMPDVIEAALNHVTIHSQIATVYNKSRYRPEVAAALQKLADALDGIEQGGAEVIALPGNNRAS